MASKQGSLDFVLDQMARARPSARKMFGEYAIYCRDKVVALFCDDELFVKPTEAGRAFIGTVKEGSPYPGAKPWFAISGDQYEDADWLSELVLMTASELPAPKPKRASTKKAAAKATKLPKKSTKRAPAQLARTAKKQRRPIPRSR